jgi:hypothetical protein
VTALARAGMLVLAFGAFGAVPSAASAQVSVFPIPGSRLAAPQTQIAFRGLAYSQLAAATITVTGSKTGVHTGRLAEDSDARGGSFLPAAPFTAGETVTVKSSLNILGAKGGTFSFTVANPAGPVPFRRARHAGRVRGDVHHYHSAPSLQPTSVFITKRAGPTAPGDIFLAPQGGPVQFGPQIVDSNGNIIWSTPVPANDEATNFAAQTFERQPVLTWWQGNVNAGTGRGADLIYNNHYQQIATVKAANGLDADLHEFQITPANSALISAYYPVYWNASAVHGSSRQIVLDGVVQEIDIKTGLVLFQWDSLDHVGLTDTHAHVPRRGTRNPFDYFHLNSIDLDDDGNLVISARNTWAAYKINHESGAVMWELGGRHSSFRMKHGASFAYQHDVRVRAGGDRFITIFDDGAGPPVVHPSRGLKLWVDLTHHTATRVAQHLLQPRVESFVEGSYEQLPNRDDFIGWGSGRYFSEYTRRGKLVMVGRFAGGNYSYRTYRFQWSGTPAAPPAIAAHTSGSHTLVWASWNGATGVASWRVLGGSSPTSLTGVAGGRRRGFETQVTSRAEPYVAVQALDSRGHVLGQSPTIRSS